MIIAASITPTLLASTAVPTREDVAARREEARMKSASAALETLKQRRSTASDDRKAAAQQKIEQLKSRIRMLQMMATTDPKGTARLAAQLARELGAAVKAYAAAGGSAAGLSATAAAAPQAASEGVETASDPATDVAPRQDAPVPAESDTTAAPERGAPATGDRTEARPNPYQKAIDAAQADVAERSREASERRADQEFMAEAKRLANELKSALRRAAEAMKREGQGETPESDEAEKAIRDVEREIQSQQQAMPDALSGIGMSITV